MNIQLQSRLMKSYPNFFRKPNRGRHEDENRYESGGPIDVRGIECDDGWYDLLGALANRFEEHIDTLKVRGVAPDKWPRALQIKEKFGELRFHVENRAELPDDLIAAIEQAERDSKSICESCGKPGVLYTGRWHHVACEACEAQRPGRKENDWDAHQSALRTLLDSRAE